MNKTILPLAAAVAAIAAASLFSRSAGIYHGSITRSTPSCGQCHRPAPGVPAGMPNLAVTLVPGARSLAANQATSMVIAATGGQTGSGLGGFAVDATGGNFAAGVGTRVHAGGAAVSHSRPGNRSWTIGYTAPGTPGLIDVYGVVNTVDGNGKEDDGDLWAFHGFDSASRTPTPVRLFVNATGVTARGQSCVGGYGNVPVLGAAVSASVGNASFGVELHGAAPASPVILLVGADPSFQFDLTGLGITGCTLYVNALLSIPGATSFGNAQRGEGSATVSLPIPNNPALRGASLQVQAVVVDVQSGRRIPVTLTNALSVRVL